MEKIFNLFISTLNDNEEGLLFKGNFLFQVERDSMKIYSPVEGKLIVEQMDYALVSLFSPIETPFNERNKRSDWTLSLNIAVPIEGQEYTVYDKHYQVIKDAVDTLHASVHTIDGVKHALKITKPKPSNAWFNLNNKKYTILQVDVTFTETLFGYFGQETTWYLDDVLLDVISISRGVTKSYDRNNEVFLETNTYDDVIGRTMTWILRFNYDDFEAMLDELDAESDLSATYTLKKTFNGNEKTWKVYIHNIQEISEINAIDRIELTLHEAR